MALGLGTGIHIQDAATLGAPQRVLDLYPNALVAYSDARLLRTDYAGACMRVRESGGGTFADIGFSGGLLDQTALLAHCGANDGFIHTRYDQSGNGNDGVQTAPTQQPQIVAAGVVLTEGAIPAGSYDGSNDLHSATVGATAQPIHYFIVSKNSGTGNNYMTDGAASGGRNIFFAAPSNTSWSMFAGSQVNGTATPDSAIHIHAALFNGAASHARLDGVSDNTGNPGTQGLSTLTVGASYTAGAGWNGSIQEIIVYDADKTSDESGIEGALNDFYSVF